MFPNRGRYWGQQCRNLQGFDTWGFFIKQGLLSKAWQMKAKEIWVRASSVQYSPWVVVVCLWHLVTYGNSSTREGTLRGGAVSFRDEHTDEDE